MKKSTKRDMGEMTTWKKRDIIKITQNKITCTIIIRTNHCTKESTPFMADKIWS